jgi:hypothetical protein
VSLDQLLIGLEQCGPQGRATLQYIIDRKVKISYHDQPTGARWTLMGNIQLNPRYAVAAANDPYTLSLVVHEVRHLQQGFFTALSVYGELDAWQVQFSLLKSLTGIYHSDSQLNTIIDDLMSLPLRKDKSVLARALTYMQAYAGKGYLVNLLPLLPLPDEIKFLLSTKIKII